MNKFKKQFDSLKPLKSSQFQLFDLWFNVLQETIEKERNGDISKEQYIEAIKQRSDILTLTKNDLINILGKQNFTFNDPYVAMRHWVWTKSIESGIIWISSSQKGVQFWLYKEPNSTYQEFFEEVQSKLRDIFSITLF